VGVYLKEFLKRIPPSGDRYELFGWAFDRYAFSEAAPDMPFVPRCRVYGKTPNAVWHIVNYPKFAAERKYNACFFPAAHRRIPRRSPCPSIGTVHDMAAFWGTRKTREHLGTIGRVAFPTALRHLDRVIAVSQWVKEELIEMAHVKESRIEVIPNGINHEAFFPRPRNDESIVLIQPFSFRRPYIIYASRIDYPIKNHVNLITAFEIFKERTHYPHRLVLAGADSRNAGIVHERATASGYRNDIFFTGHFPSASLPELYAGADFCVFPSRHEGFGMGVLEAMASGVPVVCARAASLPETAEHAALYFDPESPEDMADRMVSVCTDRERSREMKALGLERAKAFSWEACAKRTLQVIQETAAS
jgi:glycosyltransferase involved in cell wall biosynthesis